jgi:hypothetical protein
MKKAFVIAVVFLAGAWSGHAFWPKQEAPATVQQGVSPAVAAEKDARIRALQDKAREASLRLDLLQKYVNFVLKPKNELGDVAAYVEDMNKAAGAIGDKDVSEKYSATGDQNDGERKRLELFNFLIDQSKKSLAN